MEKGPERQSRQKEGRTSTITERCPQSDGFGSEAAREMAPES